jgi:agmatine/peptidylarginine deiminase
MLQTQIDTTIKDQIKILDTSTAAQLDELRDELDASIKDDLCCFAKKHKLIYICADEQSSKQFLYLHRQSNQRPTDAA